MRRLACIAAVVAATVATTACKPESARRADRAAKDVVEKREALLNAAKTARPDAVIEQAGELVKAAREFERQKSRRLSSLHATHDVIASQNGILMVLAHDMPITDAARGDLNAKLTRFAALLDEAANQIEGLSRVNIDAWEARDEAVTATMKRLDDARGDTWSSLESAPHITPGAS